MSDTNGAILTRADGLDELLQISGELAGEHDPRAVIDRLSQVAQRLMGVEVCSIFVHDSRTHTLYSFVHQGSHAEIRFPETHGIAGYNVTPLSMGIFFQKINCFCFTDQTLKAGEKRDMPVVFYVDPKMAQDADGKDVDTITLSYTFHPQRDTQRPVADGAPAGRPGRI